MDDMSRLVDALVMLIWLVMRAIIITKFSFMLIDLIFDTIRVILQPMIEP